MKVIVVSKAAIHLPRKLYKKIKNLRWQWNLRKNKFKYRFQMLFLQTCQNKNHLWNLALTLMRMNQLIMKLSNSSKKKTLSMAVLNTTISTSELFQKTLPRNSSSSLKTTMEMINLNQNSRSSRNSKLKQIATKWLIKMMLKK